MVGPHALRSGIRSFGMVISVGSRGRNFVRLPTASTGHGEEEARGCEARSGHGQGPMAASGPKRLLNDGQSMSALPRYLDVNLFRYR